MNRSSAPALPLLPQVAVDRGYEDRNEDQPPVAPAGGETEQDHRWPRYAGHNGQYGVRGAPFRHCRGRMVGNLWTGCRRTLPRRYLEGVLLLLPGWLLERRAGIGRRRPWLWQVF